MRQQAKMPVCFAVGRTECRLRGSISWVWDGGFYATIGEPKLAEKYSAASAGEALDWLRDQAILHYPGSEFAGQYAGFGP
jgi:hypothetical protein